MSVNHRWLHFLSQLLLAVGVINLLGVLVLIAEYAETVSLKL